PTKLIRIIAITIPIILPWVIALYNIRTKTMMKAHIGIAIHKSFFEEKTIKPLPYIRFFWLILTSRTQMLLEKVAPVDYIYDINISVKCKLHLKIKMRMMLTS